MPARWLLPDIDPSLPRMLGAGLGLSTITTAVLVNRGVSTLEAGRSFLNPQLNDLADPDLLYGMAAAVERIDKAARDNEKVAVYGDYDVDGTAATALLVKFLRLAGIDVDYHVPHRIEEGYGLNRAALAAFKEKGVSLVITVDCGVSAIEEAEFARDLKLDLIITDHHEPGEKIALACAVIDPKITGSMHPFRELSGVGVAFKLAWAVAKRFSNGQKISHEFRRFLLDSLGLVALGTVADIVPLLGENRVLVRHGLKALSGAPSAGLRALMDCSRVKSRYLKTVDVAFALAPRLNAAGRMADATLAARLLMTDDDNEAQQLASALDRHNRDRQKLQAEMFAHAREMISNQANFDASRAIVLAHEHWHPGVIGIVASKLVDEFNRPTALIAIEGAVGKGSARSVPGFHLFNALEGFRHKMISFGGHSGAAGFQIAAENIPALTQYLNEKACRMPSELFQRSIEVDAAIALSDIDEKLVSELELLAPHGERNPVPLFQIDDVHIAGQPRLMGMKGQHVSFYVSDGRVSCRSVKFGDGESIYDQILSGNRKCSMVVSPRIDPWAGTGDLELRVEDIHFS